MAATILSKRIELGSQLLQLLELKKAKKKQQQPRNDKQPRIRVYVYSQTRLDGDASGGFRGAVDLVLLGRFGNFSFFLKLPQSCFLGGTFSMIFQF